MSNVHPHRLKRIANEIFEEYSKDISTDFEKNKEYLNRVMIGGNKQLRNRVAGLLVRLKKNENRIIESPHKAIRKMENM